MLSAKVIQSIDLGSHTLFLAEVEDGEVISEARLQPMHIIKCDKQKRKQQKRPDGDAGYADIFMKERNFRQIFNLSDLQAWGGRFEKSDRVC